MLNRTIKLFRITTIIGDSSENPARPRVTARSRRNPNHFEKIKKETGSLSLNQFQLVNNKKMNTNSLWSDLHIGYVFEVSM